MIPRRRLAPSGRLVALALVLGALGSPTRAEDPPPVQRRVPPVLDFTMKRIDGRTQPLADFQGQVALLVNVASRCGFTPQYVDLQALYERYRDRGFVVLGFPANDFANQEPGSDEEISEFCRSTYGVRFPMFSKIHVKGPEIHPLYRYLTALPDPLGGEVAWNFQKYLVDRHGRVAAKFAPEVRPLDPALIAAIEPLVDD